jgi:hypothetical protein
VATPRFLLFHLPHSQSNFGNFTLHPTFIPSPQQFMQTAHFTLLYKVKPFYPKILVHFNLPKTKHGVCCLLDLMENLNSIDFYLDFQIDRIVWIGDYAKLY